MFAKHPKPAVRLNSNPTVSRCLSGAVILLSSLAAQAHLTYGSGVNSRDFGTFSGLSSSSVSINNATVMSNYGWADASDGVLGDSHRGRAFRFALQNEASVSFTVSANGSVGVMGAALIPGFSIYAGLVAIGPAFTPPQTDSDHDGSAGSIAWRNFYETQNALSLNSMDGVWNATGDFKIGGDGDVVNGNDFSQLSSLTYKGFGVDPGTTGTATTTLTLPAGNYTIIIGGNNIANKAAEFTTASAYGMATTLSVTPVPEPQTYALLAMGAGVIGMAVRRRRSRG